MDIEQLRLVCETVSKLGSDATTALIWYCALNLVPNILAFAGVIVVALIIRSVVLRLNLPDALAVTQRNELHAAKLAALAKGAPVQLEYSVKSIMARRQEYYLRPGVTSSEADALTQADIDNGRI